jgi:hypothetical protein
VFAQAGSVAAPARERRRPKILVAEKIADSGVDLLRERFDVDVGIDWTPRSWPTASAPTTAC